MRPMTLWVAGQRVMESEKHAFASSRLSSGAFR